MTLLCDLPLATLQIKSINEIYSHTHTHTQSRRSRRRSAFIVFFFFFFLRDYNWIYFSLAMWICGHTPHHCDRRDYSPFFISRSAVQFNCPIQYADRNFSQIETSTKSLGKAWEKNTNAIDQWDWMCAAIDWIGFAIFKFDYLLIELAGDYCFLFFSFFLVLELTETQQSKHLIFRCYFLIFFYSSLPPPLSRIIMNFWVHLYKKKNRKISSTAFHTNYYFPSPYFAEFIYFFRVCVCDHRNSTMTKRRILFSG